MSFSWEQIRPNPRPVFETKVTEINLRKFLLRPCRSEKQLLENIQIPILQEWAWWSAPISYKEYAARYPKHLHFPSNTWVVREYPVGQKYRSGSGRADLTLIVDCDCLSYPQIRRVAVFFESKLNESDLQHAAEQLAYYAAVSSNPVVGVAATRRIWNVYALGYGYSLQDSLIASWDAVTDSCEDLWKLCWNYLNDYEHTYGDMNIDGRSFAEDRAESYFSLRSLSPQSS